jgi:short-chain fatty acids transporter
MRKFIDKFVDGAVGLVNKFLPDAFIFASILTFVCMLFAIIVMFSFETPSQNLKGDGEATFLGKFTALIFHGWYGGFWSLLGFSMQMSLIIVTGDIFANTPQMKKVMTALARIPKNPGQAVAFEAFFSIFVAFFQWGAALIMSAMLAKDIARNVPGTHFALLVACGYLGLGMWHGGFSGSIPLQLPDAEYITLDPAHPPMQIPFKYTLFAGFNLFNYIGGMIILPLMFLGLHPKADKTVVCDPAILVEEEEVVEKEVPKEEQYINYKLNRAYWVNYGMVVIGFIAIICYFVRLIGRPFSLDISFVNALFLFIAMALHGRPNKVIEAVGKAVPGAAGVILQFPFYGGIAGLMVYEGGYATNDSLAEVVSNFFVEISTPTTYTLLTFYSAGLINLFIPSGGSQWKVQGPIVMPAANTMALTEYKGGVAYGSEDYKAYLGKSALALAWGDSWTNLIQPFWALPLLAIAHLEAKDIMGYCVLALIVLGVWVSIGFLIL